MKKIFTLLFVCLILGSMCIPTVLAEDIRMPHGSEEPNRIVMNTGIVTASFEGKKPKVTFTPTGASDQYKITFKRLIEFSDSNLDGAYQRNEKVAWAELESANWTHTAFYNLTGRHIATIGIGINFTYSGPLRIQVQGGQPKTAANAAVTFAVKLFQYNLTDIKVIAPSQAFTYSILGGTEVKADVIISGWPFGTENNPKLALEVQLNSKNDQFEIKEKSGTNHVNANQTAMGESYMFETADVEQKIHYLNATGYVAGFFKFVDLAIVRSAGKSTIVNVYASYTTEPEGGANQFKVFLAYPNFTGTLEHDPSFGIGEPVSLTVSQIQDTIPEFPMSATLVLIMAMGSVALILRILKRNRKESINSFGTIQS